MLKTDEHTRKITNSHRIGTVVAVEGKKARVEFDDQESALLPIGTARAGHVRTWFGIKVGEQVLVAAEGGDLAQGIIISAINSNEHDAPSNDHADFMVAFDDGTTIGYNQNEHKLTANLGEGGTADINAPGGTSWSGPVVFYDAVTCKKTINADGNITSKADVKDKRRTMDEDREISQGHKHPANNTVSTSRWIPST